MTDKDREKQAIEWARAAKQFTDQAEEVARSYGISGVISKENLMKMGATLWPISYAITQNDNEAIRRVIGYFSDIGADGLVLASGSPDIQIMLSFIARWADQAFPHIMLGQRTAAAMMATSTSEEALDEVEPPFKAFLVSIPQGLIETYDDMEKRNVPMTTLSVQRYVRKEGSVWNWRLTSNESAITLWRFGITSRDLVKADLGFGSEEMNEMFGTMIDDQDERIAQMVGRLIIAISLIFPEYNKRVGKSKHETGKTPRGWIEHKGETVCFLKNFEVTTPIDIDCREEVKDYIRNGSKRKGVSPTARTFVRGYLRRPPGGIAKGLPKVVWVQPFWRGPEGGRIIVRTGDAGNKRG
jgi:hypothetical protein